MPRRFIKQKQKASDNAQPLWNKKSASIILQKCLNIIYRQKKKAHMLLYSRILDCHSCLPLIWRRSMAIDIIIKILRTVAHHDMLAILRHAWYINK